MKIIDTQSAVLTNWEVYSALTEMRAETSQQRRSGSRPFGNLAEQVLSFLRTEPSPLGQQPSKYDAETMGILMERLRPYNLAKGEMVMILNLRPASLVVLNVVLEDMTSRFTEEEQEAILEVVLDVLGQPEPSADAQDTQDAQEDGIQEVEEGDTDVKVEGTEQA